MKKLLIASTALVATAGMAAADVSLSGYAEMGIADAGGAAGVQFHSDLDVKFSLSGETDGGLTFGATIDLDEVSNGIATQNSPASVWIKGGFGNLTMGDTDGAFDFALTEVGMLTSIADDHTTHSGYSGNGGLDGAGKTTGSDQILRYDNTFGDFGVAVSYEIDNGAGNGDVLGLGVKYSADLGGATLALGLGYQTHDNDDIMGVSVKTSISGFDIVVNFTDQDSVGSYTAVGLGYTVGDLAMTVNYGEKDTGAEGFGIAANYSLGGGATVMAGYSDDNVGDQFSLGLGLSF